ncbi:MAG: nitrilase-related carbon-nitrogen hydrolase [Armatimonadota bacterium]|nr:nitrilase-related carbon-nitrogen hydrolase [Armatimonadota bacterium]MDR7516639.1 nitrilase-related carbon-nitrogen hydrolase [Armatimonadota bacterium]MDR7560849.1 nitrilase-related carbon-nitrogen hydrolase [Armatimonadota bacterium]MDR7586791.1 nitrilase-related carbon-nitrogen hydrolase [Armatimonadota bacterium]MDR7612187.1 nitrilase-related carbon-nitrogen hydrolase [Armatimonadota bacterium]
MSRLDRAKAAALRAWLWWASRPHRVRALVRRHRLPRAPQPSGVRVTAAAVQMELRLAASAGAFIGQVAGLTADAIGRGAQLVVFPEDCGTALVGLLPGIAGGGPHEDVDSAVRRLAGPGARVADVLAAVGPALGRIFAATFSEIARATGAWVVAGSTMLPVAGGVGNVAFLFGPDGREAGRHVKCHLIELEERWGLRTGDDLQVYHTPVGRLALPICMDATYFETYRILALRGAEIVCVPTADPQPYNVWKALRGPWPRTQESLVYSVHACLVGRAFGLQLTGRSALFAPLELTPDASGVMARAASADSQEVVVGALDLQALRSLRAHHPALKALRPDLYRRVFPAVYHQYRARSAGGRRVRAGSSAPPVVGEGRTAPDRPETPR